MARGMSPDELTEAADVLAELVAPMFEERAPGIAFWGFYLKEQGNDLEDDEVLERFAQGRGVFAVELVWNEALELMQRGDGRVVRTLDELRGLQRRARDLTDGMDKKDAGQGAKAKTVAPVSKSTGPSSWLAARSKR